MLCNQRTATRCVSGVQDGVLGTVARRILCAERTDIVGVAENWQKNLLRASQKIKCI
jgi:hypothetical protein